MHNTFRMKNTFALASLVGVAFAAPQGVTDKISPTGPPPAGCTNSFDSKFEISVVQPPHNKRSLEQFEVSHHPYHPFHGPLTNTTPPPRSALSVVPMASSS